MQQPAAPVTQGLPTPGFGNQAVPPNYYPPQGPGFGPPGAVPPGAVPPNGPYSPPFYEEPDGYVDIDSVVQETQTGRFMFGVGVNSDAGLVGSIVVDEQNFDWRRWPRNGFEDFRNGTAFRGGGQRFRLEAAPGTQVQRYLANFSEPYLFDTPIGMGLSGFYYTRGFTDWTEERLGGRVNLSYQFSPDLSGNLGFGGQAVDVFNPRQPTPPALAEVLGNTSIYTFTAGLAHDTRDNTFLSTEGHRLALTLEQTIGDFVFPRINLEARKFFTLRERPDGSGRHVLSLVGQTGFSGDDTPLYDRFFIGGFSTLRGFRFRGAGPYDMGVNVGGDFMLLGSIEYMFPITADDMVRGVAFVDTGTVNENIELSDYRVAPGLGLRITVPALGPAPIALDFAVPVASGPDDQEQVFSFFVGFGR
jgi:outer membrane protein insertion porin family